MLHVQYSKDKEIVGFNSMCIFNERFDMYVIYNKLAVRPWTAYKTMQSKAVNRHFFYIKVYFCIVVQRHWWKVVDLAGIDEPIF